MKKVPTSSTVFGHCPIKVNVREGLEVFLYLKQYKLLRPISWYIPVVRRCDSMKFI